MQKITADINETFFTIREVEGRPTRSLYSMDSRPSFNRQCHSLNLIKHLGFHLKNQAPTDALPPRNVQKLPNQLVSVWYQIPQTTYQRLFESIFRQMLAILRVKGDSTSF
ncbi:hypothetical protein TNCV_1009991 [Trichonephila clavipes]|nr:hypothetical protein TNCV_1009991 [Trichonephila clavipes]